MSVKKLFHLISYLQYPLVLLGGYYYILFFLSFKAGEIVWDDLNKVLVFFGLALSFSTLQDTKKTQNKLSKRIWESPLMGKITLILFSLFTALFIFGGLYNYLTIKSSVLKELSFGMIVLGIGLLGLIKAAVEMFENHRLDKNQPVDNEKPK